MSFLCPFRRHNHFRSSAVATIDLPLAIRAGARLKQIRLEDAVPIFATPTLFPREARPDTPPRVRLSPALLLGLGLLCYLVAAPASTHSVRSLRPTAFVPGVD